MPRPSESRRKSLLTAAKSYHASLAESPAAEYLASRGLPLERVAKFRLGYVDQPEPGHERYAGMLAIPYFRRSPAGEWSVVSIRFRCIRDNCDHNAVHGGKYLTMAGDTPRLYNTVALIDNHDRIAITEGEIDAITASLSGIPAVGVAGAKVWKRHYSEAFVGYETVYVLADGDKAGRELGDVVAKELQNAKVVSLGDGEDVNSFVAARGPAELREVIGW